MEKAKQTQDDSQLASIAYLLSGKLFEKPTGNELVKKTLELDALLKKLKKEREDGILK